MARAKSASQPRHASGAQKGTSRRSSEAPRNIALPRVMLIFSVFVLTVVGLVMVFSASSIEAISHGLPAYQDAAKQLVVALGGATICFLVARFIPYYVWLGPALWVVWALIIVLLLLTAFIGVADLGAQRWLVLGPVSFQPSELAKPAFVLMAARVIYKSRVEDYNLGKTTGMMIGFVLVPLAILFVSQSDLGTMVICLVGIAAVLWLSDVPVVPFFLGLGLMAVFCVIAIFTVGYRSDRMIFINPFADRYGDGWQLVQSFFAFAEGGLFGVGLGNSAQKYQYLPEAETDFIFAILGEELGLVGALAVVVLFIVVLWAGLRIARSAPDLFGTMVAGGCTVMLVFQALLNIGCVVGLFPTTGKPLPFISSGGSSLFGSFLLVAIVLSVSFASGNASGIYERRRSDLSIVRAQPYPARSGYTGEQRRSANGIQNPSSRALGRNVPGAKGGRLK